MKGNAILRVIAKMLLPMIMLFALYVQFHGDYGPGGGFQAGVIFGSAFILYSLIYGLDNARRVLPSAVVRVLLAGGVLLFGGVGVVSMMLGGNYLDYSVLGATQKAGQHVGILVIEFGVGLTVFAAMVTIFFTFARQDH